jgi:hypothetical protein
MIQFRLAAALSLLILIAAALATPVFARNKADIVNVTLSQEGENLEVSFRILNCFNSSMEEAILSGVPTTFRIRVVLERPGLSILNAPILDLTLERTVEYDILRNEFIVTLPEHAERVRVTGSLEEVSRWMSDVKNLPIIPLSRLHKDETYQLRLKAELSKIRLPFFFRYILFFVSLWDFETDWRQVIFTL